MSFDPVSYAMGRAAASGGTDVSDTTATAADVLAGKAFHLADGTKTQGSIASKSAQTYTPTTADQTIAAGSYLAGAQTVKGDANLVAGNIKKDVTIFGVTGSHEGGGNQPTLFAPVVSGSVNSVSWSNDTRNGGFAVTLAADVDGTPVTSPLTITQQMDGSTLTITASAAKFQSAVTTILLSYINPSSSLISVGASGAAGSANECFVFDIDFYDSSQSPTYRWATFLYNGEPLTSPPYSFYLYLTPAGNKQDVTVSQACCFVPKVDKAESQTYYSNGPYTFRYGINTAPSSCISNQWYAPASGTIENQMSGTVTIYDTTAQEVFRTIPVSASSAAQTSTTISTDRNKTFQKDHVYTVIANVTFTPLN